MAAAERTEAERISAPAPEDRSIRYLRNYFKKVHGDEWGDYEMETWLSDVNPEHITPLLIAKVRLLKVLEDTPDRFYRDPMFMLHALDILNGDLPDADLNTLPQVTSLELAFGLNIVRDMYPNEDKEALSAMSKIILNNEGYTFVPKGFEDLLTSEDFPDTLSRQDSNDKQKAIDTYLKIMAMIDRAK